MYKLSRFMISLVDKDNNLLVFNPLSNKYYRFFNVGNLSESEMLQMFLNDKIKDRMIQNGFLILKDKNEDETVDWLYQNCVKNRDRLDIVILTTNACNFDCIYCFQHKNNSTLNSVQYDGILEFIKLKLSEHTYKNIRIRWFGGEPLLSKDNIINFSKKLKHYCASQRISFGASMTTNGYLLDIDTFRNLYESKVVSYQISVDGTREIHNRNRPLKNGQGTFERIMSNLINIRDQAPYSMFNINVRINFSNDLLLYADEIIQYYRDYFNDDRRFLFSFIPVFDWSNTDEDIEKANNISPFLTTHQEVLNLMKKYAPSVRFEMWRELLIASNHCWAGTKHGYCINGNGEILKCDFKLEGFPENIIGQISAADGSVTLDEKKSSMWEFECPMERCYLCKSFPMCLSTMCGAARVENKMDKKCEREIEILKNYLEIESYSKDNLFEDVLI